jgi:hypothetical protein
MRYSKLSVDEKLITIKAISDKLLEYDVIIGTQKEHKNQIIDVIRQHRIFEFIEKKYPGEEVEDRFETSCAGAVFKSLLEKDIFKYCSEYSTKTKAKYFNKDAKLYQTLHKLLSDKANTNLDEMTQAEAENYVNITDDYMETFFKVKVHKTTDSDLTPSKN